MGQRLVISILNNKERVAAIYYHWGAYFTQAVGEISLVAQDILNAEKEGQDPLLAILSGIEKRGGCVRGIGNEAYKEDFDKAKELFPEHEFSLHGSRDNGIISFTKNGMASLDDWAEGHATINIATHKVFCGATLEGEEYLDYDYTEVGENGEGGYIQSATSGIVKGTGINIFNMTCEQAVELGDFIWSDNPKDETK